MENTGQSPQTAANTTRTNRMEIQIFDNQTTDKTRTRRPPTPLTSLVEIKITTQFSITSTEHMRILSSAGGGAVFLRWPSVAVYLRSNRWLRMGAAPAAGGVQNNARCTVLQENVPPSRHARHRSLLRARCPHRIIDSALLRASPDAR